MADASKYAQWIVDNQDKSGTPEFSTVVQAYQAARSTPTAPAKPADDSGPAFNAEAMKDTVIDTGKNILAGAVKGASDIGATLLAPGDFLRDKVRQIATGEIRNTNKDNRALTKQFFEENAAPDSVAFKGGELAADVAGTAGAPGALVKGAQMAKYAPKLAAAIETGGFRLGTPTASTFAGKAADVVTRATGGSIAGGTAAGLINPEDAPTGAAFGVALPVGVMGAAAAGRGVRNLVAKEVAPEVAVLADRAKQLGIDIPADRLVNSKLLNAGAASLDYMPLSGRTGTENKMFDQFNRAISRTFGQNTDNVQAALRKADLDLGTKFERTLSQNGVKADEQLVSDLAENMSRALKELPGDEAKIIGNQIDDIISKVNANGVIDGQAAYNIKKTLDRIGNRQSNDSFYARELKKSLMGALDRSLGPQGAAEFKALRQQYSAMLDVESVMRRGIEGQVPIARLAGMKEINNPQLAELADIAAQFLKTRESPHGAMQRIAMGAGGAVVTGSVGMLPAAVVGGRAANMALNSNAMRNAMLRRPVVNYNALANPVSRALLYQGAD